LQSQNVDLAIAQLSDAILIPSEAVIPGLTEKNVFVMANGKASRRAVETGTRTESRIHILAGLNPGDVVIVSGLQQMRDGLAVSSRDAKESKRKEATAGHGATTSLSGATLHAQQTPGAPPT